MGEERVWSVERPIRETPDIVNQAFKDHSRMLLNELLEHRLGSMLIETVSERGTEIQRVKTGSNPNWYSDLWNLHSWTKSGKKVSNWRRDRSTQALYRLADDEDMPFREPWHGAVPYAYHYDTTLRELIVHHFSQGYSGISGIASSDDLDHDGSIRQFLLEQGVITNFKYAGSG